MLKEIFSLMGSLTLKKPLFSSGNEFVQNSLPHIKERFLLYSLLFFGALGGIRTPGILIRSQTLYPAELRAHVI